MHENISPELFKEIETQKQPKCQTLKGGFNQIIIYLYDKKKKDYTFIKVIGMGISHDAQLNEKFMQEKTMQQNSTKTIAMHI